MSGGPAFPMIRDMRYSPEWDHEPGMTLRDYFAAKALPAVMTINDMGGTVATDCLAAYAYADAMLKARAA